MKKNMKRILSAATGAAALVAGAQPVVLAETNADYGVTVTAAEQVKFDKIANVQGEFSFNQDTVTPGDDVFNLFGTALTGVCATPAFVLQKGEGNAKMFVNVKGNIRKAYTVNIADLVGEGKETSRISLCACASGPASAVGKVTGVKLADVLQLAEMEDGVNALKVTGSDGYGQVMPLQYALDKEAMIVYSVNGKAVPSGTQFWVPETVAKYFTRDVVNVEVLALDEVPEVAGRDAQFAAQVNILNDMNEPVFVGDEVAFEGYADDLGSPIAALEFSMDGGETWTKCPVENANTESWVYWTFKYTPKAVGSYQLTARAITANGTVSPLLSSVAFDVTAAQA